MKKALLMVVMMMMSMVTLAQERQISGILVDRDTKEVIPMVTVQLLKMDSTYISGAVTSDSGRFVLQAPAEGKYLVKMSSVGYITNYKRIQMVDGHNLNMGAIVLGSDAVMLREAQVTAQALKVTVKEDTFVYNSAAYRTPEGSTIEELVKRLPGATVDDNGKITINGKEVKKIMVDGKEFMTGDTKTALKNIPTSIIDKVKAYDQKSDLSRVTGIDDGDEQTVLDFGTKAGMGKGLMTNVDLGVGTKDRYSARLFGGYFDKKMRIFGMGNANNTNDMGFGGRGGGFGRGRNGLNSTKMAGLNMNYEKKDTFQLDGGVHWNHSDGDQRSRTSSENFVSTVGSYNNSLSQSYSRSNNFNANFRMEWTPDTMTNIMFRPTFSYSTSDGLSSRQSASFNQDPYRYVTDPLALESLATMDADSIVINSQTSNGISYSKSTSVGGMLQLNRKLNAKGRNVTLRADANYSDTQSKNLSMNNVHLYQIADALGNDSTYQTNRFNLAPSKRWDYTLQATYSEPLWRAAFLQLRYQYKYSYSKSDRSTYDFSNLGENFFSGLTPAYQQWDSYLNRLSRPYTEYLDENLSRFSEYKNYTHNIEVMFRMIRKSWQLNAGVMGQPQHSVYRQDYLGVSVDTARNVFNISPTFDFRYRINKVSNFRINYRANTTQPSISQLLDIYDDSNPLNISTGNPGLKSAFTQNFQLFYNQYFEKTQRAVMAHVNFSTTQNAISNMVTYNEQTGGRISRPENINGNWQANGAFMFNTPLDSAGVWNINTFTMANYNNNVNYVNLQRTAMAQKNTTKDMNVNERLSGSYRNNWLEVELVGSMLYRHSRNNLQSQNNLDTWQFSYGTNITLTAPWGTAFSTDATMNSRRGYNDASLNNNEFVWNAQISQSFLRSKPLTVMLQFYDLLHQQSNLSRTISAEMRSDTEYNSINSYVMLHVNYRLNLFGGKPNFGPGGRGDRGPGGRGGRGGFGRPRGGFGGPRGGFGGPRW